MFAASDGDVYLLRAGGESQFVVRSPDDIDRDLLARLERGPVEAPPGSAAATRLQPLVDAGIVVREPPAPLEGDLAERFARQLGYLQEFGDPAALQRRLRGSRVAILGCGGLGTWALGALACLGIGSFVLIDDDAVALSNLNRQVLFRPRDVGTRKVTRARAWLAEFDAGIDVAEHAGRITGPQPLAEVLTGCDALVLAADWPPHELTRWVNAACVEREIPFLTAAQQPPLLKVGPTHIPGVGPCFACHETQLRREFPLYEELAEHHRRSPREAITLGPASAVVGGLLALEVLHLLVSDHDKLATCGRAFLLHMRTLDVRWEDLQRDPACTVCGPLFTS